MPAFVLGSLSDAYRATALRKRRPAADPTLSSAAALSIRRLAELLAAQRQSSSNPVDNSSVNPTANATDYTYNDEAYDKVKYRLREQNRQRREQQKQRRADLLQEWENGGRQRAAETIRKRRERIAQHDMDFTVDLLSNGTPEEVDRWNDPNYWTVRGIRVPRPTP